MTLFSSLLLELLIALLVSWWLCRNFINPRSPLHLLDHPNERSLHETPVPRSGGIAILMAIAIGLLLTPFPFASPLWWFIGGGVLIAAVSIVDDLRDLPVTIRLLAHLLAAAVLVHGMGISPFPMLPVWLNALLLVIATVWLINLYNFMDGMDGFAGGMGLIGFLAFSLAGWAHHAYDFFSLALLAAAANAGFLWFNFPPARIFMGDVGSTTMGFLVAGFSLWGVREDIFALWFPLLVFSPFILDATVTLLRRLLRGERVWLAHREHYYQRLALAGWGHRKTVLAEYLLMMLTGGSALVLLNWHTWVFAGLSVWIFIYIVLARSVDRLGGVKQSMPH